MIYRNLANAIISNDDATSQNYIQKADFTGTINGKMNMKMN